MRRRPQWERDIQARAIEWLVERFADAYPGARICHGAEVWTRRRRGRADGLVAAKLDDGSIHTASLEAKSLRTLHALAPNQGCGAMALATFTVWVTLGVAIGWALLRYGTWVGVLSGLVGGLAGALLFLKWADRSPKFSEHAVLDQVRSYPAGEHWIAVTADFVRDAPSAAAALVEACRRANVGLVSVDRRRNVTPLHEIAATSPRDTLSSYQIEARIRRTLETARAGRPIEIER